MKKSEPQDCALCVLGSGSRGNVSYLRAGGQHCLIDAGLSYTEISRRLAANGLSMQDIRHVFITHEHSDHISALKVMTKRHRMNVYCTSKTYLQISGFLNTQNAVVFSDKPFSVDGLDITPFPVNHDAVDPVGYTFSFHGRKISVTTDLGTAPADVAEHLNNSDILMIESNHDEEMLWNGPYAWPLKERIAGQNGHLSNRQAAELISSLNHSRLKHILLAHLSQENNHPDIAYAAVHDLLKKNRNRHTHLNVTNQQTSSPMIHF